MNKRFRLLLLLACIIFCQSILADHFPPWQIAQGKPEHILASINVYDDTISDVLKRLGKPDNISSNTYEDYPTGSGERSYEWSREGVRLRASTEYYIDDKSKKFIES